jgi:hypothetical protein
MMYFLFIMLTKELLLMDSKGKPLVAPAISPL